MKRTLRQVSIALLLFAAVLFSPAIQAQSAIGLNPVFSQSEQIAFDAAYKASLPPAILAYMALPYDGSAFGVTAATLTRTTPSVLLPIAGTYSLDTQIMVWGWDPYMTTLMRIIQGYTWVPRFGGASVPVAPGLDGSVFNPPLPSYDPGKPPAGSIVLPRVSATGKIALPAPFISPIPVAPTVTANPVGFLEMPFFHTNGVDDWYSVVTGDKSAVGTVSADSRGTFKKEYEGGLNMFTGTVDIFWVKVK